MLSKVSNSTVDWQYTYNFSYSWTITASYSSSTSRQFFAIPWFKKQPWVMTWIWNIVLYNPKNDSYLFGKANLNWTAIPDPWTQEDWGYVYYNRKEHPLSNFNFSIPANTDIELYLDDSLRKNWSYWYYMQLKSISLFKNKIFNKFKINLKN